MVILSFTLADCLPIAYTIRTATGIPDDLGAKCRDELAIGAKARLLLQTGAPWANPEMGALLARMFDEHISAANLTTVRSFGRGRLNTKPNWF
jgi:hypothetical protein